MTPAPITTYIKTVQTRTDHFLAQLLPARSLPASRLIEAMHYSATQGGKRIRPVLIMAAAEAVVPGSTQFSLSAVSPAAPTAMDIAACAVECIHAYSLIHDDLPAMDDDDLRRGQPTCHIAFDEATAILAGDALQCQAFELLSSLDQCQPATVLQLVQTLARASGAQGMVAGQAIDLAAVNQQPTLEYLELMHRHKTGALIKASVLLGAIATEQATSLQLHALEAYADAIGLAFQVQDDILDVTASTAVLGKRQGADASHNKPTYVSLLGLDGARLKAQELLQQAHQALQDFDDSANTLRQLANFIIEREN